jgi:glycosyltransferase 2 family protein
VGRGLSLPWPLAVLVVLTAALLLAAIALLLTASEQRLVAILRSARRFWSRIRRRQFDERALGADREKIVAARRALSRGGWRAVLLGTVLRAACDALSLYFLFIATGSEIAIGTLMAGYALPQVAGRIVPGGVGLVEGGMVGLYAALGVPASTGVVVVLTYRVLSFWLPLLVGIPLAIVEQRAEA